VSAATKRALILAGGGLKVAFQAGVLQVWLDEAGLTFDHADGASGGCFNLAMYVQGMSGQRIADNWRQFQPLTGISFNPRLDRLLFAPSLFTLDAYRGKAFPAWGLDWNAIRASRRSATFNYYNFSRMKLEVAEPAAMTEDKLAACVSLPMWFPPVVIDGDTCIDAVYNTDANIEESIRRGADEIWVIWTVSEAGKWADGFINNYFQIIEVAANGRLRDMLTRINANNAAINAGGHGEFGRPLTVKMLRSEVDLNYIIDASSDRFVEAVNQGVAKARAWCAAEGIALTPLPDAPTPPAEVASLQFSETMKGFVTEGETDFDKGFRAGQTADTSLVVRLTIRTEDVNRFITQPRHEAIVTGTVSVAALGGDRPIEKGTFNLLIDTEDPHRKLMTYRLLFADAQGQPVTLVGYKDVRSGENHDVWTATTTLFTRLLRGDVHAGADETATILASGIIRIHMLDFLVELTTFRVEAPTISGRIGALRRFGQLFLGELWDVYASRILPESPI
jgi:predicted patatin/cPLA2 family phospholipase